MLSPSGVDNELGYLYPLLVVRCLFYRMAFFLPEFLEPLVPRVVCPLVTSFFQDFFFCTSCLYNGEAEKTLAIVWCSILRFFNLGILRMRVQLILFRISDGVSWLSINFSDSRLTIIGCR